METIYQIAAEVRIWHDYWLPQGNLPEVSLFRRKAISRYDISSFLQVRPTKRTKAFLEGNRLLFKPTPRGFLLISEVERDERNGFRTPFPFQYPFKLSFDLVLLDPYFLNYTNLPLEPFSEGKLMYFSNLSGNQWIIPDSTDGQNAGPRNLVFLSKPLPEYDAADPPGQYGVLLQHQGRVYEVIGLPVTQAPGSNGDTGWRKTPNSQYVSALDLIPLSKGHYRFQAQNDPNLAGTSARFGVSDFFGKERMLGLKNIPGAEIPLESFTFPAKPEAPVRHSMPLDALEEGIYRFALDETGFEELVFVQEESGSTNPAGVIELFHRPGPQPSGLTDSPFAFLERTDDGHFRPKGTVFHLHFYHRSTFWRLFFSDRTVIEEPYPRPLKSYYARSLVHQDEGSDIPLTKPDIEALDQQVDEQGVIKYFSSVYLFHKQQSSN